MLSDYKSNGEKTLHREISKGTDNDTFFSDGTLVTRGIPTNNDSASKIAKFQVKRTTRSSAIIFEDKVEKLPTFQMEELELGKLLGSGSFSEVYEIKSIEILHKSKDGVQEFHKSLTNGYSDNNDNDSLDSYEEMQLDNAKNIIARTCTRKTGEARFAIKFLSSNIIEDPSLKRVGATDLALEVMILSNLRHPNIVKIRGVSTFGLEEIDSFQGYFLILDRLYDTVDQRISIWARDAPANFLYLSRSSKEHYSKRLIACYDLASAIKYLHERKIIFRDLKPQNVGFDVRGDVKLFDFGLARELKPEDRTESGKYKLTGNTGTRRYMAPEVALSKCYNLSADVYSFSILLWEIWSLKQSFSKYSYMQHLDKVILGVTRPNVKLYWPFSLRALLRSMWAKNPLERPDFSSILPILKILISKFSYNDLEPKIEHVRRRSTYFMEMNQ